MGICSRELRRYIIRPSLKHLGMWSSTGENLLLGTAAQESQLGSHIKYKNHRALGIYQISPKMHRSIWDHYLAKQPELSSKVRGLASQREFLIHPHHELATNLSYATAIAWLIYHRTGIAISKIPPGNINELGQLWRRHFHSHLRKVAELSFIKNYQQLISKAEKTSNFTEDQFQHHSVTKLQYYPSGA